MAEKTKEELNKERIAAERKSIDVENSGADKVDNENIQDDTVDEDEAKEEDVAEKEEDKEEDVEEDGSPPDLAAKAEDIEKLKKTIARLQRRLDKETGSKKELRSALEDATRKLNDKVEEGDVRLTAEDAEKLAEQKAAQKVNVLEFERMQKNLIDGATKLDKDFLKKIQDTCEDVGPLPAVLIPMLTDLDNGPAVLLYYANNPDELEELYKKNEVKAALALARLSEKILKPKKEISKAPNPPDEPLGGKAKASTSNITGKESMDEYVRKRNAQIKQRMEERRLGLRP